MRLIGKSAFQSDLPQGRIRGQHQALRVLHSSFHQIGMRRASEAIPESPHEMGQTQAYQTGQVFAVNDLAQMPFDVRRYESYLPGCQAASALVERRTHGCSHQKERSPLR
jgi:hypothetical protein